MQLCSVHCQLVLCCLLVYLTETTTACPGQIFGTAMSVMNYGYMTYRATEPRPGYKGCYRDDPIRKDFAVSGGRTDMNSILGCNTMCRQKHMRFFGVQNHDCFCGNVFGKYGKVDDDHCKIQCPGKPSETCGGFNLNAVYVTV